VGFLAVLGNYVLPQSLFGYLLATTGAIALFVYLVIACSQLVMRRRMDAEGERAPVRMWAFPTLTWVAIVFIVAVLVLMLVRPGHRIELLLSAVLAAVIVAAGLVLQGRHAPPPASEAVAAGAGA
jgi:GABA permease